LGREKCQALDFYEGKKAKIIDHFFYYYLEKIMEPFC